jgi:hypothetical protein
MRTVSRAEGKTKPLSFADKFALLWFTIDACTHLFVEVRASNAALSPPPPPWSITRITPHAPLRC